MNTRHIEATADTHTGTVDALLSFMVDCQFTEPYVTAGNIVLALEYVCQPRPRFWRDLRTAFVVDAVTRYFASWPSSSGAVVGASTGLLQDIEEFVLVNAFDEANAEKLLKLPKHLRPTDPASAFAWLRACFVKNEMWKELELAERDREHCAEQALELVYRLEQADRGAVFDRPGTLAARAYRDSVVKRYAEFAETGAAP